MTGGRVNAESDMPRRLANDAQSAVRALRRGGSANVESVIDYLVSRSRGSADRLLDVRDLLGQPDAEARALL